VDYPDPVAATPIAVLISGTGSNLAALIEHTSNTVPEHTSNGQVSDATEPYRIVGVIADRDASGLEHARRAGIPTQVVCLRDFPDRATWDQALARAVGGLEPAPRLVVLAGFMKLVGPPLLEAYPGAILNTHPALLPAFPGAHGVRDALAAGVKITGATVIEVDAGVDTGRILAQRAVDVHDEDTEETLHERIKAVERDMLVAVVSERAVGLTP
jgi:phosphoribosylglycinamide formyltransferase-1